MALRRSTQEYPPNARGFVAIIDLSHRFLETYETNRLSIDFIREMEIDRYIPSPSSLSTGPIYIYDLYPYIYIPASVSPLSLSRLSPLPPKKNIFQFLLPTTSLFFWANSLWFWFCGVFGTRLRTATATTTIYHQLQLNNYNSTA